MVNVTFNGDTYRCKKTVKSGNSATLYLEDGGMVRFDGVSDWSVFDLDGGEWSSPEITVQEQLRSDVTELQEALNLILTGVTE